MSNMSCKRNKKWLGAVISGVANIASTLISAKNQANAIKEQQLQQDKQLAIQHAANLTAQYNNTDYVDAMKDKIVYRAGGKIFDDRIKKLRKISVRNKKELGGKDDNVEYETNPVTGRRVKKIDRSNSPNHIEYNPRASGAIRRYLSPRIMNLGEKLSGINGSFKSLYENPTWDQSLNNTYRKNVAQNTYLMSRRDQRKAFLNSGYIEGIPGDYGLVRKAVGNRKLPVYQRNKDVISRDSLEHLGNYLVKGDFDFIEEHLTENKYTSLENAHSYPVAFYRNKHNKNKFYFKGWDLNDYGVDAKGDKGLGYKGLWNFASNIVDAIGNPTVVTTGYQQVTNEHNIRSAAWAAYNKDKEWYNSLIKDGTFEYNENRMKDLYDTFIGAEALPYLHKHDPNTAKEINSHGYNRNEREEALRRVFPYEYFKNNINSLYDKERQIMNGVYVPD